MAILDAAEPVFQRAGFYAARVEELAEAADVSVGTLYGYFPGKHGVYLALVERALELFEDYMRRSEDPTFTPLQRVLAGGDAYLRFHLEHPGYFQFFAYGLALSADAGVADSQDIDRICQRVNTLIDRFARQIDEAIAAGEAIDVDALTLTRFAWGSWNGVISLHRQPPALRITDEQIIRTLELGRWILRQALATPQITNPDGTINLAMPSISPAPTIPGDE